MNHDGASDHDPRQGQQPDAPPGADLPEGTLHPEYRINIYRDWCKGCGICAAFCPRHCLGLDAEGNPVVEKSERCTGCRWCELHCPDFAICVREVKQGQETPKE
jgi:NAD-dependent dihydropyrimidine dehydrogenase PreA subunit